MIAGNQAEQLAQNAKKRRQPIASDEEHANFINEGVSDNPFNSGPAHTDINTSNSSDVRPTKISKLDALLRELYPNVTDHGIFLYVADDNNLYTVPTDVSNAWSIEYFKSD